jgi:flagellin
MAQRILTLATQASNGTVSSTQRIAIADEMVALWSSVGKIQDRTKFSGISLLDASASITVVASNVTSDAITISSTTALEQIYVASGTSTSTGVALMAYAIDTAGTSTGPAASLFTDIVSAAASYITYLDTQRASLGAVQNQLEYAVDNITTLSANLTSARSQVIDTDYAAETASLTKGQILQQAATAMLAQANQMPNVILSLLK